MICVRVCVRVCLSAGMAKQTNKRRQLFHDRLRCDHWHGPRGLGLHPTFAPTDMQFCTSYPRTTANLDVASLSRMLL